MQGCVWLRTNRTAGQHLTQGLPWCQVWLLPYPTETWYMETQDIDLTFCLVADDLGIKYVGKEHAEHLVQALQDLYIVSANWKGELYCGPLTIKWNYNQCSYAAISMPG
jgi:hypothetical protein